MITPPPAALSFEYIGPVRGDNRRLAWSPSQHRAFPDRDYASFKRALCWTITRAMGAAPPWPYPLAGPLLLLADFELPPRMDTTALVKPLMDALQLAGAIIDDHQIEQLRVRRTAIHPQPARIFATLCPLPMHDYAPPNPTERRDPPPPAAVNPHNHAEDA